DVHWELSFGKRLAPTFQILGKVVDDAGEHVITIDKTTTELTLVTGDAISSGSALRRGLEDVGLLPAGWKHGTPPALGLMLFVVILLLGARGMTKQARDVGALIGGVLVGSLIGGVAPWGWLVLPTAALVVLAAGTVAIDKLQDQRWVIAAIGGVLYGIVQREAQQPLAFGLGLSLGPVVALIVVGPLVGAIKREGAGRWLIPVAALAIAALAAFWIIVA
ncbi:MAG TPA: hypothetical protein VHN14_13155, partial [Kofleriaceae bacterium]|nr:hypothetical protein [Kofleriaceae bacterium]